LRQLPAGIRQYLRADEGCGDALLAEAERRGLAYAAGVPLLRSVRERIVGAPRGRAASNYRKGSEVASFRGRRRQAGYGASSSAATRSTPAGSFGSRAGSGARQQR